MGEGFHGWSPKDEIEFVKRLTKALPRDGDDVADSKERAMLIIGYGSAQRPVTRAERLDALRKYLEVLPSRHFPGWSQREQRKSVV